MSDIQWTEPFCTEAANCFQFGIDDDGNAYIGRSDTGEYISDSVSALRALILAVKSGEADHLL
ncbi:hypothetical protein [Streptomyces sp. 6N223]|uniref:hypothetical protein n=1 Tax=Streptomyces sp. 6N223 TaxID=3457412 RepID=UPI003FD32735